MAVDHQLADLLTTLGRTSDAMVAVGADLTIVAWNEGATELFGYTADEALGRPCYSVMCWRGRCGKRLHGGRALAWRGSASRTAL